MGKNKKVIDMIFQDSKTDALLSCITVLLLGASLKIMFCLFVFI